MHRFVQRLNGHGKDGQLHSAEHEMPVWRGLNSAGEYSIAVQVPKTRNTNLEYNSNRSKILQIGDL